MRRIDTPDGQFQAGDRTTRRPGTIVPAWFLNMLMEELISIITAAGIELDGAKQNQVLEAIKVIAGAAYKYATADKAGLIKLATNPNDPREVGTAISPAQLQEVLGALDLGFPSIQDLQWLGTPIRGYITPYSPPPTDDLRFRYILCTAGQTGAGGYNEGVLTDESVTGTAPLIEATAVVNLTGSPLNGQLLHLINTEGRFVGAGVSDAFENDSIQNITGYLGPMRGPGVGGAFYGGSWSGGSIGGSGLSDYYVNFDASRVVRTSNKTQPRAHRVPHYMRIL